MSSIMNETIALWPAGDVPGAAGQDAVDVPTLTRFEPPAACRTGAAIVVCPGGGYQNLAPHEGAVIGQWLAVHGVTAFVLKYRLAPRYKHPAMLQDVSRAIRTIRHRAGDFALDPQRIGVLGFSAGGHLAATVSTQFDTDPRDAGDPIDRVSARPDVCVLCYPVISFVEPFTHAGSRNNLIGTEASRELVEAMSAERRVSELTPPTFLFHTAEDPGVPVENALVYAVALQRHGVAVELHVFERGRHGVGLAQDNPALRTWPALCINWLALRDFAKPMHLNAAP